MTNLWMPQFRDKGETKMAGINRATLPVLRGVGKSATEPMVAVTENGQIRFNSLAAKIFGDSTKLYLDFNEKRELKCKGWTDADKLPKGYTDESLFPVNVGKSGAYISAAAALRSIEYDFKASGQQSFKPAVSAEKRIVGFVLPKGALTPHPKVAREKKVKAPEAVAAAATGEIEL
jgi:hypothetical protein